MPRSMISLLILCWCVSRKLIGVDTASSQADELIMWVSDQVCSRNESDNNILRKKIKSYKSIVDDGYHLCDYTSTPYEK